MQLQYILNPAVSGDQVAVLRTAVKWDARGDKMEQILGATYMSVGCFDGERLVGFVDVISDRVDDALIRILVVHPQYQRKGIALQLLKTVIEQVRTDRIRTTNVLFETDLSELYRKAGFRIIGGGVIDNEVKGFLNQ